jgi:DNA-binding response OmpR family regulator
VSKVLVVEDEVRIASFVERGLAADGHDVTVANDGNIGLDHALTGTFDLVLLDLGLPGKDGFEVLEAMRAHELTMPVIILTAREDLEATVRGFDLGADDYVTKPFRVAELLARVRARLRKEQATADRLEVDGVVLDVRARTVEVEDKVVELTAREFALAEAFFQHAGQVLTRQQLLDQVWGYDHDPDSNVVDVYVGYLRRKVGKDRIRTVRGMGYRLG